MEPEKRAVRHNVSNNRSLGIHWMFNIYPFPFVKLIGCAVVKSIPSPKSGAETKKAVE
jgi:hypothetical protein